MSAPKQIGCLVLLNGYPGVGKLSVARTLRSKLQGFHTSPTRLIDNHLIIDPAQAVHPGRGPEHKAFRTRLRHVILDELKSLSDPDTILIMTLSLKTDKEEIEVFAEHVDVARARGIPCYAFTLFCDKEEHVLHLQSPERVLGEKTKLTKSDVLENMVSDSKILDPTDHSTTHGLDADFQLHHNFVDTTELSPEESALRILEIVTAHNTGKVVD